MASSKTCLCAGHQRIRDHDQCIQTRHFRSLKCARNQDWGHGSTDRSSSLKARAATSYSLKATVGPGPSVSQRTATRDSVGSSSLSNSTRFALKSRMRRASPVMFPPDVRRFPHIPRRQDRWSYSLQLGLLWLLSCGLDHHVIVATMASTFS